MNDPLTEEIIKQLQSAGYPTHMRVGTASRALGVSVQTLTNLRKDGQVDATLVGKQLRYSRAELARYLARGSVNRGG